MTNYQPYEMDIPMSYPMAISGLGYPPKTAMPPEGPWSEEQCKKAADDNTISSAKYRQHGCTYFDEHPPQKNDPPSGSSKFSSKYEIMDMINAMLPKGYRLSESLVGSGVPNWVLYSGVLVGGLFLLRPRRKQIVVVPGK
jgi:hypothetical protein